MSKYNFEKRTNIDGTVNESYVDLLVEDKPISGQKFVCISFLSPEKILKQKQLFFFEEFLKYFDFETSIKKFTQFVNFLSFKYKFDFENAMTDLQDFIKDEKDKLIATTIEDDYKGFLDKNEERLQETFDKKHTFQSNIRGIKIRGSYQTQEEAELRCKMLREVDPAHDVYVGPVGMWMPWEPDSYKTGRVEYMEEELNQLMKEMNSNEDKAKKVFEQRVKDSKKKAIAENKQKAKKHGNKLTQNINEDGELVSNFKINTIEKSLGGDNAPVSSADIRKELFEGENIRTKGMDSAADEYEKRKKGAKN